MPDPVSRLLIVCCVERISINYSSSSDRGRCSVLSLLPFLPLTSQRRSPHFRVHHPHPPICPPHHGDLPQRVGRPTQPAHALRLCPVCLSSHGDGRGAAAPASPARHPCP